MQFGAHVQQRQVRLAQRSGRRGQRVARVDIGQLRDRQRIEQLDIAQTTAAALQVGLGTVRDLTAALPARLGEFDELVEPGADPGAPLPAKPPTSSWDSSASPAI